MYEMCTLFCWKSFQIRLNAILKQMSVNLMLVGYKILFYLIK